MGYFDTKWPALLMRPLAGLYGLAIERRNRRYETGVSPVYRLDCPVISVGNIVVGGTGKTPTVLFMVRWLQLQGKKVCVLSRGYRRRSKGMVVVADGEKIRTGVEEAGDEPMLLAQQLPGAIVVVDSDRVRGGRWALQNFKPDIFVLDDGFQHRRLHRDLDIVTFKEENDLGNGWLLPAGPLREPLKALARAGLLWFNGAARIPRQAFPAGQPDPPQIRAQFRVTSCRNSAGDQLDLTPGVRAVLFCGLAKPQGVLTTALGMGLDVVRFFRYRDHHNYRQRDIHELEQAREHFRADVIITTDKDWVKIHPAFNLYPYWFHFSVAVQPEEASHAEGLLLSLCRSNRIL